VTRAGSARIFVGVLRLTVQVRGARSLKDRRQVLVSIRDRMRHRYDVTFNEVGDGEDPSHRVVVVTTAGNDGRVVRSVLDQCARMLEEHPVAVALQVDVDVMRWHPSGDDWASRMMAEVGSEAEDE
jgi:uncharacterized protein